VRHSPCAFTLSSGSRSLSHGPGCALRRSAVSAQVAVPAGSTWIAPDSCVCGACCQKARRSSACMRAWACGSGCAAQGVTMAVTVAFGASDCGVAGALPATLTRPCASSRARGPATVALKASGKVVVRPGTEVVTLPWSVASTRIGPVAMTVARPWYWPEATETPEIRNWCRVPSNR
jgi:hypothetical protein